MGTSIHRDLIMTTTKTTVRYKTSLTLIEALQRYAQEHRHPINRLLHHIGIPLIIVGFLIFLSFINISFANRWHVSFAWLGAVVAAIVYVRLHTWLGSITAFLLFILTALCSLAYPAPTELSGWLLLACLVVGVLCLSVGHWFEKSKSQPWNQVQQTWIAPLFSVICLLQAMRVAHFVGLDTLCAAIAPPPQA